MRRAIFFAILLCGVPPNLFAQRYYDSELPRYELGLRLDLVNIHAAGAMVGGGATFHYNFNGHLALDSQFAFGPVTISGGNAGGHTTFLTGIRTGQRVEDSGFFIHARGGFLHYVNANGTSLLSRTSFPAFNVGGTFEQYFGPIRRSGGTNMVFRLEFGALIVPYGSATIIPSSSPTIGSSPAPTGPLRTRVGPVLGLGIGFRF
ncbi:MAG: hypothetical protein DMG36_16325 [Acidobacteria bacterium]|nr:MAG: hypothetical protein DMG36_16325 [Acidobacteriota bacterium]